MSTKQMRDLIEVGVEGDTLVTDSRRIILDCECKGEIIRTVVGPMVEIVRYAVSSVPAMKVVVASPFGRKRAIILPQRAVCLCRWDLFLRLGEVPQRVAEHTEDLLDEFGGSVLSLPVQQKVSSLCCGDYLCMPWISMELSKRHRSKRMENAPTLNRYRLSDTTEPVPSMYKQLSHIEPKIQYSVDSMGAWVRILEIEIADVCYAAQLQLSGAGAVCVNSLAMVAGIQPAGSL